MRVYAEDPTCGCRSEINNLDLELKSMQMSDNFYAHTDCHAGMYGDYNPGLYYLTFEVYDEP